MREYDQLSNILPDGIRTIATSAHSCYSYYRRDHSVLTSQDPHKSYLILRGKQERMSMNTPLQSVNLTTDEMVAPPPADIEEHESEEGHAHIHMPNGSLWPFILSLAVVIT